MRGAFVVRWVVLAGLTLGAANRSAAQGGFQTLGGWSALDDLEAQHPALLDRGAFGRTDSGDYDSDGHLDALGLEGDRAFVLYRAGTTFALTPLPGVARGACTLRGASTRIALATDAGLEVLAFDAQLGALTGQAVLGGDWAGALDLRAFDADGDGESEVYGIRADRSGLIVARQVAGVWTSQSGPGASGALRDVVALQWDGDAALELALLTDTGVYVHDDNFTLLRSWSSAYAGGALARVSQAGQALDRLAWISDYAPPQLQWLRTLSADGSFEHVDLGALDAYALVSADFDADGDSDLLIAPRHGEALLWLENLRSAGQPACPTFVVTPATARVFELPEQPLGAPQLEQRAWPAVADFDADGDFDLLIGVEATRSVLTRLGDWIDEAPQRCDVLDAHYDAALMRLELELAPPQAGLVATHWLVDIWRAADEHAQLDGEAFASFEAAAPLTDLSFQLDELAPDFASVYRLCLTPIQRNAQGAVVARGCPTLLAFAVSESAALALEQEAAFELSFETYSTLPENMNANSTVTRARRIKTFQSGERPVSSPPTAPQ